MDYKNALLGVASLLALTAGMQDPAAALNQRPEKFAQTPQPQRAVRGVQSEAFLDLLMRTNGDLSMEALEGALVDAFSNPSPEQIQNAPEMLRDFVALGLSSDGIQRLRDVLREIVSLAENVELDLRASVVAQLDSDVTPFVLAQARKRACTAAELRNPRLRSECRDPNEVGQTRPPSRDPGETGQVGPGGGGGYQ
jgi:hypothetical protein